jgi:hypothetical protein
MFHDAFRNMDRLDNFSYEGREALFEYLESYEDDAGATIELDVIALCCDYTEASYSEIAEYYSLELEGIAKERDIERVREYLEENTALVGETSNGVFLYQNF